MVKVKPEQWLFEGRGLTGKSYGTVCILIEVWVSQVFASVKIYHMFHWRFVQSIVHKFYLKEEQKNITQF